MSFINIYVVLIILLNHARAISIETLQKWHNEVTNMKYNCPAPREIENSFEKTPLLLEVVDCNQPLAIYRYDFKVRYLLISKLCNQVPSLSLFRWRTLNLLKM